MNAYIATYPDQTTSISADSEILGYYPVSRDGDQTVHGDVDQPARVVTGHPLVVKEVTFESLLAALEEGPVVLDVAAAKRFQHHVAARADLNSDSFHFISRDEWTYGFPFSDRSFDDGLTLGS